MFYLGSLKTAIQGNKSGTCHLSNQMPSYLQLIYCISWFTLATIYAFFRMVFIILQCFCGIGLTNSIIYILINLNCFLCCSYNMGVISTKKSLAKCDKLSVSSFCRYTSRFYLKSVWKLSILQIGLV